MVTIGINNKIPLSEAADYIGCSQANLYKAIRKKLLKVYKVQGKNFFDQEEVSKAKESGLIKGRPSQRKTPKLTDVTAKATSGTSSPALAFVKVQIEIDKAEFDILSLALKQTNKSLNSFIGDKIKALTSQVKKAIAELDC